MADADGIVLVAAVPLLLLVLYPSFVSPGGMTDADGTVLVAAGPPLPLVLDPPFVSPGGMTDADGTELVAAGPPLPLVLYPSFVSPGGMEDAEGTVLVVGIPPLPLLLEPSVGTAKGAGVAVDGTIGCPTSLTVGFDVAIESMGPPEATVASCVSSVVELNVLLNVASCVLTAVPTMVGAAVEAPSAPGEPTPEGGDGDESADVPGVGCWGTGGLSKGTNTPSCANAFSSSIPRVGCDVGWFAVLPVLSAPINPFIFPPTMPSSAVTASGCLAESVPAPVPSLVPMDPSSFVSTSNMSTRSS